MLPTAIRLSIIRCEGTHGEDLKLVIKHSATSPRELKTLDKNERAASILPPSDGVIALRLQVRIDRKLVSVQEVQTSGLLKAIRAFIRDYGPRLRIQSVEDVEIDHSRLEVPLHLEPFPSPLMQHFGPNPDRFESLDFAMNFYSPASESLSSEPFRNQLLSGKLTASVSSLIFRAMLKSWSGLAAAYPLVFDLRWLQLLQCHLVYLPSLSKSIARLTRKSDSGHRMDLLQRCMSRLNIIDIERKAENDMQSSNAVDNPSTASSTSTRSSCRILQRSTFSFILRATKHKHALNKLQLAASPSTSAEQPNDLSQELSLSSNTLLLTTPPDVCSGNESFSDTNLMDQNGINDLMFPDLDEDLPEPLTVSSIPEAVADSSLTTTASFFDRSLTSSTSKKIGNPSQLSLNFENLDSLAHMPPDKQEDHIFATSPAAITRHDSSSDLSWPFPSEDEEDMHVELCAALLPYASLDCHDVDNPLPDSLSGSQVLQGAGITIRNDECASFSTGDCGMDSVESALDDLDAKMEGLLEEHGFDELDEQLSILLQT